MSDDMRAAREHAARERAGVAVEEAIALEAKLSARDALLRQALTALSQYNRTSTEDDRLYAFRVSLEMRTLVADIRKALEGGV